METKPINITNKNRLIRHYRSEQKEIMNYFDYKPFDDFNLRIQHIENRTYKRDELANLLHTTNKKWGATHATLQQIEHLRDESSVVVIGGQQAGLLTGPLYSINKLISIVRLAREQEANLQRPVIPVFWIAGEDHDLDEINHIYTTKNNTVCKHRLQSELNNKTSVSHLKIDQDQATAWLQETFSDLQETEHTKKLYEEISTSLFESDSYVDFFAKLIFKLFPDEGIVLVDSADTEIRHLESAFFEQLITKQKDIAHAVFEAGQTLQQANYSVPLDLELDDAHLFYHDSYNERILLKREDDIWIGKNGEVEFTTEELIALAKDNPDRLSNNVVTRPLAQEFLFPTLAFIGGDGEISYWATLKHAFHHVGYYMPPVLPRMSFTYQTNRTTKLLTSHVLEAADVIEHGLEKVRLNWLMNQLSPPIEQLFHEVHDKLEEIHTPLHDIAKGISVDLEAEAVKNLNYMKSNLDYLQRKVEQKLTDKYEQQLAQFDELSNMLKPNGVLQERIWSPLPFVNEYGVDFLRLLMNDTGLSMKETHYTVIL